MLVMRFSIWNVWNDTGFVDANLEDLEETNSKYFSWTIMVIPQIQQTNGDDYIRVGRVVHQNWFDLLSSKQIVEVVLDYLYYTRSACYSFAKD